VPSVVTSSARLVEDKSMTPNQDRWHTAKQLPYSSSRQAKMHC